MTTRHLRILVTGFGPFPGAPENPTGPLVRALARRARPAKNNVTVKAHVFPARYKAVDKALPRLLRDFKPDAIIMFGLATRSRTIRVETLARNRISRHPDAAGFTSGPCAIDPAFQRNFAAPAPAPAATLLRAVKRTGLPARISKNAGDYLCNYILWHATRATAGPNRLKLSAFIHVPKLSVRITPDTLLAAGEAIIKTAIATLRRRRR